MLYSNKTWPRLRIAINYIKELVQLLDIPQHNPKPPGSRGALALKVGTVKDRRTHLRDLMNFSQEKTHPFGYPQNVKALKNNQATLHHDTEEGKLGDALIFSPSFRHLMSNIAI